MSHFERFHVIAGGPGSGKSTLIEALGRRGHAHSIEAGRAIRRVFLAPPWPEIFRQDAECKQTREEARRTREAMVTAYSSCGY